MGNAIYLNPDKITLRAHCVAPPQYGRGRNSTHRKDWWAFLDTYRTKCVAPDHVLRHALDLMSQFSIAA
jgi:hypothetical protein